LSDGEHVRVLEAQVLRFTQKQGRDSRWSKEIRAEQRDSRRSKEEIHAEARKGFTLSKEIHAGAKRFTPEQGRDTR
jgi:hypothetical protein